MRVASSQDQKRVVTASIVVSVVVGLFGYFAEIFGIESVWLLLLCPGIAGVVSGLTFYIGRLKDKKL